MNNQIIVTMPSSQIRAIARQALTGEWKKAALITFLMTALVSVPVFTLDFVFYNSSLQSDSLSGLYSALVGGPFVYGGTLYFMSLFRKKEHNIAQLFSGFDYYFKCLSLYVIMMFFIFLWTLLLIVPGIIAAFRYSQAFFVLVDHPEYTAMQCIDESKRIMTGNKAKLFCLELSFFGWAFLANIPSSIVTKTLLDNPETLSAAIVLGLNLLLLVLNIGMYFVTAYMLVASVVLYDMMTGKIVLVTQNINNDSNTNTESAIPTEVKEEFSGENPEPAPSFEQLSEEKHNGEQEQ